MPLARVRETAGLAWEWAWRPVLAREGWCGCGTQFAACLPAAPERWAAHHRDELVVPLLLVVVLTAEELADARVVCLRGGGGVSSAEGIAIGDQSANVTKVPQD